MVQQSLVTYINGQVRAGYSPGAIRSYLLKYGYSPSQLDEAFRQIYDQKDERHYSRMSKTTIALAIALICSLAMIIIAAVTYFPLNPPSNILDVSIIRISPSVKEGGSLDATIEFINMGKSPRADISLRYEVYDLNDRLVTFKEDSIALETKASATSSISLSRVKPGRYYLKVSAKGGKRIADATSSFTIVQGASTGSQNEESAEDETAKEERGPEEQAKEEVCPLDCSDNNECTRDYCSEATGYDCRYDPVSQCCGNKVCEDGESYTSCIADCPPPEDEVESMLESKNIWDKLDLIREIGKTEKEKAVSYCNKIEQLSFRYKCLTNIAVSARDDVVCDKIEDEPSRDNCYRETAIQLKISEICAKVKKDSKRDQCYMEFVMKGDYTLCEGIVNKYQKQSCESLKQLSEIEIPPPAEAQQAGSGV